MNYFEDFPTCWRMVRFGSVKKEIFSHNYPLSPLSIVLTVAHPVGAIYFSLQLFDSVKIKDGGRSDYIIAHVM